jgi:hypothetical protein
MYIYEFPSERLCECGEKGVFFLFVPKALYDTIPYPHTLTGEKD